MDGGIAAASTYAAPDRAGGRGHLDHAFAASHLLDVMPNPWRGSEIARRVFGALLERHDRGLVVSNYGFILEELHKRLEVERDRLARGAFVNALRRLKAMASSVVRDATGLWGYILIRGADETEATG